MSGQRKLCLSCMSAVPADAKSCPKCGYNGTQKNPEHDLPIGYRLRGRYVIGMEKYHDGDCITYAGFDCSANVVVEVKEFLLHGACKRGENHVLIPNSGAELHYKTAMMDFCELYRNLAKLSAEPNVIHVNDFFEANQTAYAVLETFNGVSLREFLEMAGGSIPFEKAVILLTPVMDALSRIHSVNLIHRGVSPETIFVNRNGDVKLGGYATSSVRTKDTEVAPKLFSGYSAPEQYSATKWQNASTDVYGMAAVFYRCLTGVTPQDASQRQSYDSLEQPIALQSTVPQYASRAIMLAMLMDNKERVQSILDFKRLLNNLPLSPTSKTRVMEAPAEATTVAEPVREQTIKKKQLTTNASKKRAKKKKEEKQVPWVSIIVVTVAVLAVIGVMFYVGTKLMDTLNPEPDEEQQEPVGIEVPDYVGSQMSEVKFDRDNFKYTFEKKTVPDTADKLIVDQEPKAGSLVSEGTTIILYYNESEKIEMIDVLWLTQAQAEEELKEAGIKYEVVEEGSKEYAKGTVIRQSIQEGAEIDPNTQIVTITVAIEYTGLPSEAQPAA